MRDYEFSFPNTAYAATEGGGVYKSDLFGLQWEPFDDGLMEVPGARNVRTLFVNGSTVLHECRLEGGQRVDSSTTFWQKSCHMSG